MSMQDSDSVADQTSQPAADEFSQTESAPPTVDLEEQSVAGKAQRRPLWPKLVALVAIGTVFATVGWLAGPPRASKAAQRNEQSLLETSRQRDELMSAKAKMEGQLKQVKASLAELTAQAQDDSRILDSQQSELAASKTQIDELTRQVQTAQQSNEPMLQQLQETQANLAKTQELASAAQGQADKLANELVDVESQAQQLKQSQESLRQAKAQLEDDLRLTQQHNAQLKGLLGNLEIQKGQLPAKASKTSKTRRSAQAAPGQMPLTEKEMTFALGSPGVSMEKNDHLRMEWGQQAVTCDNGVVEAINGKPADRSQVLSTGARLPEVAGPVEAWRFERGKPILYTDLVDLFGKPEAIRGTGNQFTASWAIGAWARSACATVSEGIVTEFDGRAVDPEELCQLVRQRAQAYRSSSEAVTQAEATNKAFYVEAGVRIAEGLRHEREAAQRDGLTLKRWNLGAFHGVGSWIAPTNLGGDAMTLRTVVDCQWEAANGTQTTTRRYAVVTLANTQGHVELIECVLFDPKP